MTGTVSFAPAWRVPMRFRRIGTRAGTLLLAFVTACASAQQGITAAHAVDAMTATCAAGTESRFEFHSSFWLNLHNYLYKEAKLARGIVDDGLAALGNLELETPAQRAPTAAEEGIWTRAITTYGREMIDRPLRDSAVIRVNNALARVTGQDPAEAGVEPDVASALRQAAPVYRALWWPAHDAHNREWIAQMRAYLGRYESCVGHRLARVFGADWRGESIRVDATVYASWYGAYTTFDPLHITMSSNAVGNQGASGFEGLMHEAGHAWLGDFERALAAVNPGADARAIREVAHLVLFYTAGDLVWRAIPGHSTNAARFGVWAQNERAGELRDRLRSHWRPYLDGERSFEEAVRGVIGGGP
ncbi:MAG: hypothetical protein L0271_20285 [Gemmatimonadetes bacterium]|nr:hypothetical protein [Gemmatimonadota bacterium]